MSDFQQEAEGEDVILDGQTSDQGEHQEAQEQPASAAAETPADDAPAADDAILDAIIAKEMGEEGKSDDDPKPEAKEAKDDEAGKEEAKAEADDAAKSGKDDAYLTKDDLAKVPEDIQGKINRRISNLTRQRKEAEEERDTLKADYEKAQPAAEAFNTLFTEMEKADLNGNDMSALLQAGAAIKSGDPDAILRFVGPIYEQAMRAKGEMLSPEYQRLVDSGEITPEAARQAQADAARADRFAERNERLTAQEQQRQQAQQAQQAATQRQQVILGQIETAKAALRQGDPLFDRKAEAVDQEIAQHIRTYGLPPNETGIAQMAKDALARVTARQQASQKARRASPGSTSATPVKRDITSFDDAFEAALEKEGFAP